MLLLAVELLGVCCSHVVVSSVYVACCWVNCGLLDLLQTSAMRAVVLVLYMFAMLSLVLYVGVV